MSEWSEIVSIKQEPELDIVSDNEGDPLSNIQTNDESSSSENDKNTLEV